MISVSRRKRTVFRTRRWSQIRNIVLLNTILLIRIKRSIVSNFNISRNMIRNLSNIVIFLFITIISILLRSFSFQTKSFWFCCGVGNFTLFLGTFLSSVCLLDISLAGYLLLDHCGQGPGFVLCQGLVQHHVAGVLLDVVYEVSNSLPVHGEHLILSPYSSI